MKTILKRKDKTSIYIPPSSNSQFSVKTKMKILQLVIGCSLLVIGLFIMMMNA